MLRDRYVLEDLLGFGAMGAVWRARDRFAESAGDREPYCAIKVLSAELAGQSQAEVALQREASRAQKLAHPNICSSFGFDRDAHTGEAFIVMELLEGQSLEALIRRVQDRGLPPGEALPLVRGMAEALAYAHRRGIIHSDFKPSNVFVTRDGAAKVLDFGIARVFRPAAGQDDRPVNDDSIFTGYTATYAAPDAIARNDPHPADDVFSMGLVAYELLAGRHPFERRSAVEARTAGMRPAPIAGLGRREWAVLARCLSFERAQRYADAGAVVRDLQGRSRLHLAFAALAAVAIGVAGISGYRSYQASRPAVAFEELPAATQTAVTEKLRQGEESLRYLRETGDVVASADAADFFGEAYALHPRNPDAVAGLEQAAAEAIRWYQGQNRGYAGAVELRRFEARSEFYRTYAPLQDAIRALEGS